MRIDSIPGPIASLLLATVREEADRLQHLLTLVPRDDLDWRPTPVRGRPLLTLGELIGHLPECLAGFCAALYAAFPERLAHFQQMRTVGTVETADTEAVRGQLVLLLPRVEEGFALVADEDLVRRLPTVFVPEGQALLTILMGNLEHLINHKHQLFLYLRLLGVDVGTPDLYRLPRSQT